MSPMGSWPPSSAQQFPLRSVDSRVANRWTGDGRTLGDRCNVEAGTARHGTYVRSVGAAVAELERTGVITGREAGRIVTAAARSDGG